MPSNKILILCVLLLNFIVHIRSLVELPDVEDNNIVIVERAIRNTVNNLFAGFKIEKVKHSSRLKEYSTIHNFLVSITMTDCDNLKKIARLTRVNNIDNNTQYFIAQINEALNGDDKSYEENDGTNVYVTNYINMFIKKLQYLKHIYVGDEKNAINADILKYFNKNESLSTDNFENSDFTYDKLLDDSEFWRDPSSRRIFQGKRTRIKNFPFMASIQFFRKFQCAGSILKDDLVITSSSCLQLAWNNRFFRENPAFLSVQIGSDFYEGGGENIGILEIYFHPSYDPRTLTHNLGLLRLMRKLSFKKKKVKKIDFDRNPNRMPSNAGRITVVGWGARDSSNVIYNVLKNRLAYAELDLYPLSDCQEHYSEDFVTDKHFCAGFYTEGGGACNRDAGGPGIIEDILMGIISFGSPICGAPDFPTVFTKLGYYADWIETIMEQDVPHAKMRTTKATQYIYYPIELGTSQRPVTLTPITTTKSKSPYQLPTEDEDNLRLGEHDGFKNFLDTMFSKEVIKDNTEETNIESNINKIIQLKETTQATKERTVAQTLHDPMTTALLIDKIYIDEIPQVTETKYVATTTESQPKVTVMDLDEKRKTFDYDIETLIENLYVDKSKSDNNNDMSDTDINYNNTIDESIALLRKEFSKYQQEAESFENKEQKNFTDVSRMGEERLLSDEISRLKQQTIFNFFQLGQEKTVQGSQNGLKRSNDAEQTDYNSEGGEITLRTSKEFNQHFEEISNNGSNSNESVLRASLYDLLAIALNQKPKHEKGVS